MKNFIPEIVLAPITGYTDHPFRLILRELGFNGPVYSEMVDCHGIIYNLAKVKKRMLFDQKERPIAIQISGNDSEMIKDAALKIEDKFKPNYININLGCPSRRTTASSSGASLLRNHNRIREILAKLTASLNTPICIKTRLGWNSPDEIFPLIDIFNEFDLQDVAIHLRTRKEMFHGKPHWEMCSEIKNRLKVPFTANGGITTIQDIIEVISRYKIEKLMIGMGFIQNPWLYSQLVQMINTGKYDEITIEKKVEIFKRHLQYNVDFYGETKGIKKLRKFIRKYFSNFPTAANVSGQIMKLETYEQIIELINNYTNY
jgi:tRNA-dihydrouridine synthase B